MNRIFKTALTETAQKLNADERYVMNEFTKLCMLSITNSLRDKDNSLHCMTALLADFSGHELYMENGELPDYVKLYDVLVDVVENESPFTDVLSDADYASTEPKLPEFVVQNEFNVITDTACGTGANLLNFLKTYYEKGETECLSKTELLITDEDSLNIRIALVQILLNLEHLDIEICSITAYAENYYTVCDHWENPILYQVFSRNILEKFAQEEQAAA